MQQIVYWKSQYNVQCMKNLILNGVCQLLQGNYHIIMFFNIHTTTNFNPPHIISISSVLHIER